MVDFTNPADLNQLSDIVSRRKISDRRLRNEAIRQGSYDQSGFDQANQSQIQQAQQPSEFRQAGNPLNDATIGLPTGYSTVNTEGGKYNIFNDTGTVVGTGYQDVRSAIKNISLENALKGITSGYEKFSDTNPSNENRPSESYFYSPLLTVDRPIPNAEFGGTTSEARRFSTQSEAEQAVRKFMETQIVPDYGGVLGDYEALGQLLSGTVPKTNNGTSGASLYTPALPPSRKWGGLPGNNKIENISGLNTLFGSTPVFKDGNLIGYKVDFTPGADYYHKSKEYLDQDTPLSMYRQHTGKSHAYQSYLERVFNNGDWSGIQNMGDGNSFVGINKAASIPGWTNKDTYNRQDREYNDGTGSVLSVLGTLLSFTPLAPIGLALSTAGSLANNNPMGAALGLVGAGGGFDAISGGLGDLTGLAPEITNAITKGGMSALGTAASGGNLRQSLMSGLGSGLGTYAGGNIFGLTAPQIGNTLGKMLGGAASSGIQSLFTKNNPISGSLYGGMSGGLNALLNSTSLNDPNRDKNNFNGFTPQMLQHIFRK